MGTASYVLAGPNEGMNRAFGSSCHGAGRRCQERVARQLIDGEKVKQNWGKGHLNI